MAWLLELFGIKDFIEEFDIREDTRVEQKDEELLKALNKSKAVTRFKYGHSQEFFCQVRHSHLTFFTSCHDIIWT